MYFDYDDNQQEFRTTLRRLLAERSSPSRVRSVTEAGGHDPELWAMLRDQMGLPGLHVPEEYRGGGFGLEEISVVALELGRALAPVPMLATIGAIEAVTLAGDAAIRDELLPRLASGEALATVALADPRVLEPANCPVTAGPDGLTGVLTPVVHGSIADMIVVPAVNPVTGEVDLHIVESGADGVVVTPAEYSYDCTMMAASVELSNASSAALQVDSQGRRRVLAVLRVLTANEALGAAEAVLDMAVAYASTRVQFNRPIGSFQAVKHKCADMAIAIDGTRAAVLYASMVVADASSTPGEVELSALTAILQATDALTLCAEQNIQVHGGIGFTQEGDPHLYFRRARVVAPLFGDRSRTLSELADLIGI